MKHSTNLPPLDGLQAVLAVQRAGSFSAAAAELAITHGAVSRRIGVVERWAGVPLFERHGRGARLTIEGQRFVGLIEQALEVIASAAAGRHDRRGLEVVCVSVIPSFARLWLLPNIAALEGSPPDFRLDCDIDHRFAHLTRVDVAIRYGSGRWREAIATPLFEESLIPVAVPALARLLGDEPSAKDLLRHPLIHDTYPDAWRLWMERHRQSYRLRPQDRRFPDYDLVLHAAAAGRGVALLRRPYGNAFVENGSLVPLGRTAIANPSRFYALAQLGAMRRPVQILIERLVFLSAPGNRSRRRP